jgi:HEAT repeat protein
MKKRVWLLFILFIACGLPPHQKAMNVLEEAVNDESVIIKVNAAKALRLIGDAQGTKILYEVLKGEDKNGIAAALSALYDLKEDRFSPVIIKLAGHRDPLIRTEAYKLISLINDERCHGILVKGAKDKISKIRRFSYFGLEKFEEKKEIMNGLRDADPLVRIVAARALGNIGIEDMENFIRKELEALSIDIWKQGIIALAEMNDTSAIPFIKESLTDAPWELRLIAAEALLILNNKEGVEVLKEGLNSDNPFTRVLAVRILKNHPISEAPDLLKEAIKDDYVNVSVVAIEALAAYKTKANQKAFIELMDAPNPLVKIAAAAAYLQSE